jgi:peptide/nickel transport system substrate-binding protein
MSFGGKSSMGSKGSRTTTGLIALLALVSVVVAACSSDDDSGSSPGTTSAEASAEFDADGVLHVGIDLLTQDGNGPSFDPAVATFSNIGYDGLWYLVYGRFMRPNDDGTLTPELAERATVVDANTIEIVVRDGVTFSDGTPLDGAAVKASMDRALASRATAETGFQAKFYSLQSTTVTAPNTVRLSFLDGTAPSWFDQYIPQWQTTVTKPGETDWARPIGAGPMKLVSNTPGDALVLTKNDSYFDADSIKVAGYEFTHIPETQTASGIAAVQAGQLDIALADSTQLAALPANIKPFTLIKPSSTIGMHICKADAPLSDARVRQAINKGMDREAISGAVFAGEAEPQTQIWPSGHRFNSPELDETLAHDPDGAKQLLAEAGYPNGVTIDMHAVPAFGIDETAQILQQQLGEVGIDINFVAGGNYLQDFLQANKRAIGLFPGNASGIDVLSAWSGEGVGNVCDYQNPELNDLILELRGVSQSDPEAVQLWQQVNELAVDEALGGFIIYRPAIVVVDDDTVGGLSLWPIGAYLIPDAKSTFVKVG